MYLIVIEADGTGDGVYHYQPYRLAASVREAKDMMLDYLKAPEDSGALDARYFALYQEKDGEFGSPDYFDPSTTDLEIVDATDWLQETGRA